MDSRQESVLEEFMQRSFGAPFLFEPRVIQRGRSGNTEPADLAWIDEDRTFVVLFYMHESIKDLEKQIDHNARQARKYLRLWSTKGPVFALRGLNRYQDERYVPFNGVRRIVCLYVVSCECGVEPRSNFETGIPSATLCIPDRLIHRVAQFGGTIVDLLLIIEAYLKSAPIAEDGHEANFVALMSCLERYVQDAIDKVDPEQRYLRGSAEGNFQFVLSYVTRLKMSPSFGPMPTNLVLKPLVAGGKSEPPFTGMKATPAEVRNVNARIFGDLSLVEYLTLAAMAARIIQDCGLPDFARTMIVTNRDHYHSFVAASNHADSDSSDAGLNEANRGRVDQESQEVIRAAQNSAGELDSLLMFFTDIPGRDYRVPMIVGLPATPPPPHAHAITDRIIGMADAIIALFSGQ